MLHYQIEFDNYQQHLVHVTMRFVAHPSQVLWLPTWIPGSYLVREFAKHIESVKAFDEAGRELKINKFEKNKWHLFNTDHEFITVEYDVYAYDLSVRGSYVDQTRFYINPACVCLGLLEQEDKPCELELFLPQPLQHFGLATGLPFKSLVKGRYTLKAHNYEALIDSPFELAEHTHFTFEASQITHDFFISGKHSTYVERLKEDLQKICETEIKMFGSAPFKDYTFMTIATGNSYGGLEHPNSTSLITPRNDLPQLDEPKEPSEGYQRFLGLCSHEYFHSWLVKFIRPENYTQYNLHQESYTSLLWVFEGFTSYYDDLILLRSGVISQDSYLKLLKAQINRYLQNKGRFVQSVAESSFDTWIKFYRPDENTNNAGTSYYNKGALVALCLDLELRRYGASLDDVVRGLYQKAQQGIQVTEQLIVQLCESLTQQEWTERLAQLVHSTHELPLDTLLENSGIKYEIKQGHHLPFGLKLSQKSDGLWVQQAMRDGIASQVGLSAHDVIVAIDGIKATEAMLKTYSQQKGMFKIHAFRRDELMVFTLDNCHAYGVEQVELCVQDQSKVQNWLMPL